MSKPAWLGWPLALAAALGPVVWLILYWWVRPDINVQETSANPSGIILVCLLYPLVEELAFRGYFLLRLIGTAFDRVPIGTTTTSSFDMSSLLFGLAYERWFAAARAC